MLSHNFRFLSEYIQIAIGIVLASIGLKAFLLPNGFLDGGVTGIALLVNVLVEINISFLLVFFSIHFYYHWLLYGFKTYCDKVNHQYIRYSFVYSF